MAPQHLDEARQRLRAAVAVARQESDRVASMFDVFRLLTDEVREIASSFRARGRLLPQAAALGDEKVADRIKEALRVPLAIVCVPGAGGTRREVRFLTSAAPFADADLLPPGGEPVKGRPEQLPFWNARAARPPGSGALQGAPRELVDSIVERGPTNQGELELLRAWFAPDPPRAIIDRALRAAGAPLPPAEAVRAVVYFGEIADPGTLYDPEAAHELFGRAAREARAYLEAYTSSVVQVGPMLAAIAFERPPFRTGADEALLSAGRFAQEVARAALERGIRVRAVVSVGEGTVFEEVNGRTAVASPSIARASVLLSHLRRLHPHRAAFAVEGASPLLATALGQRLLGWEKPDEPPDGAALWLGPA